MLNVFGSKKLSSSNVENVIIAEKAITVEDIHREFMTASEKILSDMTEFKFSQKAEKAKRLERLGFTSTKDNVESKIEFLKEQEFISNKKLCEIVDKYRFTHPNNKVITEKKVHEICKKYNLIHTSVNRYSGFVPEKNLKEVENFKFPSEEAIMVFEDTYGNGEVFGPFKDSLEAEEFAKEKNKGRSWPLYKVDTPIKRLTICAPIDKIQLRSGEKIEGNKIVYPDPIILHKIENNCYLIVTAWGDEASDPEVINEKMN